MRSNHIFIVRHGESENNLLEIDCSKLENKQMFGLTESGREQTENEARQYTDFTLVITSPLRRAKETATIFARHSRCEIVEDELLIEVNFGDLELCSYQETDAWYQAHHRDDSVPFPHGESYLDVRKRVAAFLRYLDNTYVNQKILIVTHGHLVLFLQELLQQNGDRQYALDNYDDFASRKVIAVRNSDS